MRNLFSKCDRPVWILNKVRKVETSDNDPVWMKQVLADLERHEGYREYAYPDPLSEWAKLYPAYKYRWGFKPASVIMKELGLSEKDVRKGAPWTVGIGFTHGVTHTSRTTRAESYERLRKEVIEHAEGLDDLIPGWREEHDMVVQTVLVNMIFNLGKTKLSAFAPTLALIKKKDYKGAAARIRKTPYFKQVGARSEELMRRLETGTIDPKYKI